MNTIRLDNELATAVMEWSWKYHQISIPPFHSLSERIRVAMIEHNGALRLNK